MTRAAAAVSPYQCYMKSFTLAARHFAQRSRPDDNTNTVLFRPPCTCARAEGVTADGRLAASARARLTAMLWHGQGNETLCLRSCGILGDINSTRNNTWPSIIAFPGLGRSKLGGCLRLAFEAGVHAVPQHVPGQRAVDHQHVAAVMVDHLQQGSTGECQGVLIPGRSWRCSCEPQWLGGAEGQGRRRMFSTRRLARTHCTIVTICKATAWGTTSTAEHAFVIIQRSDPHC